MNEAAEKPSGRREQKRQDIRLKIEKALLEALASGEAERLTHDRLAEAAGVGRRTVYRYFPDRDALMRALYQRINQAAGPQVRMPDSEQALIEGLPGIFKGFDHAGTVMTVTMSSAQGRAVRLAMRKERVAAYRASMAAATVGLEDADKVKAMAAIQLLASGHAWLEMRDQWGLDGASAAEAALWAIKTLLADLRARRGKPLDCGPAGSQTDIVDGKQRRVAAG